MQFDPNTNAENRDTENSFWRMIPRVKKVECVRRDDDGPSIRVFPQRWEGLTLSLHGTISHLLHQFARVQLLKEAAQKNFLLFCQRNGQKLLVGELCELPALILDSHRGE
tara:strand:- start:1496 stop:1825 length:330 start_codon:yes stop_codon:yes gene_type:complete